MLVLIAWLLLACGGPVQRVDLGQSKTAGQAPATPKVLMVTLRGKLGTQELARCHRTLRQADALGCSWVVFRLEDAGSIGEDAADLQSLYDHVQRAPVATAAVLGGRVVQGAAALALVCRRAYCLRNAAWGEIQQPDKSWQELVDDAAFGERVDAARDAMRLRLERRDEKDKLRPDALALALAMVDPRQQMVVATVRQGGAERERVLAQSELAALTAGGAKIVNDRPLPNPLVLTAQEAEDFGLSNGTLQDLDHLAEVLAIDREAIGELQDNWAEHMVGWLELLHPFLLIAGFLLLLVEIKTPGLGLAGLLGVVFLALALFHSYLVGLAEITEILVFFLGLSAIAVEIFLLPGMIVFGAVGFLCLVLSLILSRQSFVLPSNAVEQTILLGNLANLMLLFVSVLVLGAIMWRVLPKVPWFNRVFLPPPVEPAVAAASGKSGLGLANDDAMALVGRVGTAATVLRPTGAMEIDGQRIDVVTEGEFVPLGTPVRVLYVHGPRVVVAPEATAQRPGERGSVGLVVLLCIVGLALLVAEVMFVSFGIIATCAGIALLSAVFVAFQESTAFGVTMVVVEAIAAPIVLALSFKLLPKTRFGKALILSGPTQSHTSATEAELRPLVGKAGVTLSALRPAGFARIDGRRVDVVTRGEMIENNRPIVVLEVAGNRVVVAASATQPDLPKP